MIVSCVVYLFHDVGVGPISGTPDVPRYFFSFFFFFCAHFHLPASGQAVVTGVFPFPPRFLPSIFIAHRVQQSHCSSIVHRVLLTHALGLSASQFVHKKKSQRIYTSMHSAGLELTKLSYTRLEDNLIRHRGDRIVYYRTNTAAALLCCCVVELDCYRMCCCTAVRYCGLVGESWVRRG